MYGLHLAVYASPTGTMIADWSHRARNVVFSTGEHGYERLSAFIDLPALDDQIRFYDRPGLPHVIVSFLAVVVWEGRLEDVAITDGGLNITALGYWRALTDAPYSAVWSDTGLERWRISIADDLAGRNSEKHIFDKQNRLFVGLKQGATYVNGGDAGAWMLVPPHDGSRQFIGFSCDLVMLLPSGWNFDIYGVDDGAPSSTFVIPSFNNVTAIVSTGVQITRSLHFTFAGRDIIYIQAYNFSGVNVTYTGEDGANFFKITNIRAVTTTTNRINTTLTANRNAGTSVTATVGSTARMYVGQRLTINSGAAGSEAVTVESITSSTQFVATFANNHLSGEAVQAHVVYGDEIAKDFISVTSTLNSTQISSSTALVQSPSLDLTDEVYEEAIPSEILTGLAVLGDNQTTPRRWEVGIYNSQALYFRPKGDAARQWYVDITSLELERTLETLTNSVYATYKDASGRVLRTSANTDSSSTTRYGVTRRAAISSDTTSSTQANTHRDTALQDRKEPQPRAAITFNGVYDALGARHPLWEVRAGDQITIRNLPPTTSTTIDRIRSFRIGHTEYRADDDELVVEPETPIAGLAFFVGRQARGIRSNTATSFLEAMIT